MWRQRGKLLEVGLRHCAERFSVGGIRAVATARRRRGKHWVALWGNGDHGRLGLSSTMSHWEPTLCSSLQDYEPTAVACGGAHTLVLTEEGRVFSMGLNDHGQLGVPFETSHGLEPVQVEGLPDRCVHIAAGYHHSAAIADDGAVYVWGSNLHGQLGLGKKAQGKLWSPQQVTALTGMRIKRLALGSEHSLCLCEDGEVLSWGAGQSGRLGHSQPSSIFRYLQNSSEFYPRIIDALRNTKVQAIAAGLMHSACVEEHGNVLTFGQGRMCQLGLGNEKDSPEPSIVSALPSCRGVSCGGYHTAAITRNGDLYMWGSNEYGCLGFGYKHTTQTVFPMKVEGAVNRLSVTEVACGWKHTCALTDDGQLFSWGWGGSQGTFSTDGGSSGGQLGLGDEFDYNEPSPVSRKQMQAIQISCGFNHTAAIFRDS